MSVKITAQVHPFSSELTELHTEPRPVTELLEQLAPGVDPCYARVLFDDEKITNFNRVPPDGSTVYMKIVPGGDGPFEKEGGKMAGWGAVVTLIGVAACFIPVVGGFIGASLIGTGLSMMAGGYALANVDIPSVGDRATPERGQSIRGSRNRENQWGYIPVIFGRHLIYPDPAAKPYTVIEGNDQWLVQLFCAGYNDIEIETDSLKIGDTSIVEYSASKSLAAILGGTDTAIKMEILMAGQASALYPKVCREQAFNQILKNKLDDESSGALVRTTPDGTTEVNVDIFFYNGLGRYNDDGDVVSTSVTVQALIKAEAAPDTSYVSMGYFSGASHAISGAELKTKRYQVTKAGLTPGKYTIRIVRDTPDSSDSKVIDDVYVGSIRSYTADRPIRAERQSSLAIIALKAKATDRLNNVIDQFNLVAQSKLPVYSGAGSGAAAWTTALTKNPAAMLKYALQGKISSVPVADVDIDWLSLEQFALWCDEHGYTCNAVLSDKKTLSDLVTAITRTARAEAVKIDSKFSVVQDVEKPWPVQLFTPKNTRNYQQTIYYSDIPDALDLSFVDEAAGFQPNERRVYNTDTGEAGETDPKTAQSVPLWGVTDRAQAFRLGRYDYACMLLRPRAHVIEVDIEYLLATKGSRIQYAGDIALAGIAWGRIKAVVGDPDITGLVLDEYVDIEAGISYGIRIRKKNGAIIILPAIASVGYTNSITLEEPITGIDPRPEVGDLYTFGVRGKECLDLVIMSIDPTDGYNATLHCVDYSPGIFDVDQPGYVIPPFDSKVTVGGVIDSGVVSPREWKEFTVYHDGVTEPDRPIGDGSDGGWHLNQTALSVWRSTKKATAIDAGQWGAPVRFVGVDGDPGAAAPILQTQYSVDGSTGWTATYNASHIYMRTSADGGSTWGAAVRIKGETGTDGQYTDYRFAKNTSATTAPTYTAAADNPGAAWTDTPPTLAANEYLWMINADWRGATRLTNWTAPVRLSGPQGTAAPNLQTQYSVDGSTGWTATYNASHIYMRTSADGGTTWGAAVRIKGETGTPGTDGLFTDYRFAKNTSATTAPEYTAAADNPGAAWTDTPPTLAANEYLWMLNADWRGATRLTNWTAPVRLSGPQGAAAPNLQTQYSVDGSTGWTATYNASHIYMRTSADGGTTWGAAVRIKGETGADGADTWTPVLTGFVDKISPGVFRKRDGYAWGWDSQVYSLEGYDSAFCSAQADADQPFVMFGLNSDPTVNASYDTIDFAFYLADGAAYIYESGNQITYLDAMNPSMVFTIVCDGVTVKYYKDSVLVRSVSASGKKHFDSSFAVAGRGIKNVRFGPMGSKGDAGTDGQFTDYRFAKNTSATSAPAYTAAADNPGAAWTDTPPTLAANEYLWMINADWRGATRLTNWTAPVRLSGPQGSAAPNLQTQYSVDGSTGWTATYNSSHIYMRTSADGGTTWGAAVRIKGETGLQGVRAWQYLGPATSDPTSGMVSEDIYLYTTSLAAKAGDSKLRRYTTGWADITHPTSDQISAAQGDILNRATFLYDGTQQAVGLVAFFALLFALDIIATGSITGAIFKSLDGKIKISRNVSGAFDGIIISTGLVDSPVNGDFQVLLTTGSGGVPGIHFYKRVSGAWQDQGKIISNFLGLANSLSTHYGDSYTQLDSSGFLVSKVFRAKKGIAPTLLNVTSPVTDAALFDKLAEYTVMDDGIYTLHGIAYTPTSAMYGINIRKLNSTTYYIKFDVDGSLEAIVQGGATQRGRFYAVY